MLFRTPAQKADLKWSWERCDRAFFAAGACHVLAHEFLKTETGRAFHPVMILPDAGFRGGHVFCSAGATVFDYHGFSSHESYVAHFRRKITRFFPGWRGQLLDITDTFWTNDWFKACQHRRPEQYYHDPNERARRFINRHLSALRLRASA